MTEKVSILYSCLAGTEADLKGLISLKDLRHKKDTVLMATPVRNALIAPEGTVPKIFRGSLLDKPSQREAYNLSGQEVCFLLWLCSTGSDMIAECSECRDVVQTETAKMIVEAGKANEANQFAFKSSYYKIAKSFLGKKTIGGKDVEAIISIIRNLDKSNIEVSFTLQGRKFTKAEKIIKIALPKEEEEEGEIIIGINPYFFLPLRSAFIEMPRGYTHKVITNKNKSPLSPLLSLEMAMQYGIAKKYKKNSWSVSSGDLVDKIGNSYKQKDGSIRWTRFYSDLEKCAKWLMEIGIISRYERKPKMQNEQDRKIVFYFSTDFVTKSPQRKRLKQP